MGWKNCPLDWSKYTKPTRVLAFNSTCMYSDSFSDGGLIRTAKSVFTTSRRFAATSLSTAEVIVLLLLECKEDNVYC